MTKKEPNDKTISAVAAAMGRKGGKARAAKMPKPRRVEIASAGGKAAQEKITTEQRRARAKKAWATRRASEKKGGGK